MAFASFIHPSVGGSASANLDTGVVTFTPGDRVNAALDLQNAFRGIADDGFVPLISDGMKVVPTAPATKDVVVSEGHAWVRGVHCVSHDGGETVVTVDNAAEGNPRIDLLIIRHDPAERDAFPAVLQGTNAADPVVPTVTQDPAGVWEIPFAELHWPAGATALHVSEEDAPAGQGWIVDRRRPSLVRSGGSIVTLNTGTHTGGAFSIDLPAWAVGRFGRLRLSMRGSVSEVSLVAVRVNNDTEAALHRTARIIRRASDGTVTQSVMGDITRWLVARWGTMSHSSVDVEIWGTEGNFIATYRALGSRVQTAAADNEITESWGRINSQRLVSSLHISLEAGTFAAVKWWLDGIR